MAGSHAGAPVEKHATGRTVRIYSRLSHPITRTNHSLLRNPRQLVLSCSEAVGKQRVSEVVSVSCRNDVRGSSDGPNLIDVPWCKEPNHSVGDFGRTATLCEWSRVLWILTAGVWLTC